MDFNYACPAKQGFQSLFLKPIPLSIIYLSIYLCIAFIHAFITPSIVIFSINPWLDGCSLEQPSIHGCSRESIPTSEKTRSQRWIVFSSLKLQSLIQMSGRPALLYHKKRALSRGKSTYILMTIEAFKTKNIHLNVD